MANQSETDRFRDTYYSPKIQRARHLELVDRWRSEFGEIDEGICYATDSQQQREFWSLAIDGQKILVDPKIDNGCCAVRIDVLDMCGNQCGVMGFADLYAYKLAGGWLLFDVKIMLEFLRKTYPWGDHTKTKDGMSKTEWHSHPTDAWLSDYWKHQPNSRIFNVYRYILPKKL